MRFLILSPDFPMWDGGVCVWAEKLAKHLCSRGHFVHVITPLQLPEDVEFDKLCNFKITRTRNIKDRYYKYYYAHWKVFSILRKDYFDHVIATTWFPYANAALYFGKIPVTIIAHGNDFLEKRWQRWFWRQRMNHAFRRAKTVIAVSKGTAECLKIRLTDDLHNVQVITPGINVDDFPQSDSSSISDELCLLTIGRVVERKGQENVIRCLPKLIEKYPNIKYKIAGKGNHMEVLKALTIELGVEDNVEFLGFVDEEERLRLYQKCTLYVMPSRSSAHLGDYEGFGITYLEANSCGKAVIGGNEGGVTDAIEDGLNGLLADPHSVNDIYEKIDSLLSDQVFREKLGRQGRIRAEKSFSWNKIIDNFLTAI